MENYNISNLNTIEELTSFRQAVNEAVDNKIHGIKINERAESLKNNGFGFIKESFENLSGELYNAKGGLNILKEYVKTIKENKNLSKLHTIYETIRKAHKDLDVDYFINGLVKENWGVNAKTLNEDVNKLGGVLAKGYRLLGENAEKYLAKPNVSLDSAVEFISENVATNKNIAEYGNAIQVIKENIMDNDETKNMFKGRDIDELTEELVDKFNNKYGEELTDDEKETVKNIAASEKQDELFEDYKEECLRKLSETLDALKTTGESKSAERIHGIYEHVSQKVYNEETFTNDIASLIDICKTLNE